MFLQLAMTSNLLNNQVTGLAALPSGATFRDFMSSFTTFLSRLHLLLPMHKSVVATRHAAPVECWDHWVIGV